jgi:hypothetical protein
MNYRGKIMGLFRSREYKEYIKLAAVNNGSVAIMLETRKGKKEKAVRAAFIVDTPKGFAIKMNELMMVNISFRKNFPVQDEYTYFRYAPVQEKFNAADNMLSLDSMTGKIKIRTVPYYDCFL